MRAYHRQFALVIAAIMATTSAVMPADARAKKKQSQYQQYQAQTPSLDGRITGRTRTCGFDSLQYDGYGVPYGPYCH
jgi:hypothetical protein